MTEGERTKVAERLPGKPRDLEKILQTAYELLERDGFKKVSVEAIAAHAGVSKVTIYRWWPNKAAVIMDAFLLMMVPVVPFPDTGSICENLRQQMLGLVNAYRGKIGQTFAALVAEGQSDLDLANAFRSRFLEVRREPIRGILKQGILRGELRPDIDIEVTIDILYGPINYRLLIGHAPLDEYFIEILVEQVVTGIRVFK